MVMYHGQSKCFYLLLLSLLGWLLLLLLLSLSNTICSANGEPDNEDTSFPYTVRSLLSDSTEEEEKVFEQFDNPWPDYRDGLPSNLLYHISTYLKFDHEDIVNFIDVPSLIQMDDVLYNRLLSEVNETIIQTILNNKTATLNDLINNEYGIDLIKFYLPFLIIPQQQWSSEQMEFWDDLRHTQTIRKTQYVIEKRVRDWRDDYCYYYHCRVYDAYYDYLHIYSDSAAGIDFTQCNEMCKKLKYVQLSDIRMNYMSSLDNLIGLNKICDKFDDNHVFELRVINNPYLGPIIDLNHSIFNSCDSKIEKLLLGNNDIQTINNFEKISEMTQLKRLDLEYNELTSFDFSKIVNKESKLEVLDLSNNEINGSIDLSFVRNSKISRINLAGNQIHGISNFYAVKHSNLVDLDLTDNDIASVIDLKDLVDSPVAFLYLSNNPIKSIKNFDINTLKLTKLDDFWCQETNNIQLKQKCQEVVRKQPRNRYNDTIWIEC